MTISADRNQTKTKKCPKCNDDQPKEIEICNNCQHKFKPRMLHYHEIKTLIIDKLGATPRLNIRTGEVLIGDEYFSADDIERFYLELSDIEEQWPIKPTSDAIWSMAEKNKFDPIKNYLDEMKSHSPLPMEQWQQLDKYLLGIENKAMAEFLPQYLVGAVARIYEPGCEARCLPVLVSKFQEIGKSETGKILFSCGDQEYWVEGLSENLDKDTRMRCQTAWACELAELDGVTRRSDVAALKAFLTERTDSFRKPYGKGVERYPRNFVFWGTSNEPPLRDLTGNSRFLCVELPNKLLPLDWIKAQRNAIWARAVEQYGAGFEWNRPTAEQKLDRIRQNEGFQQIEPWIDLLKPFMDRREETTANGVVTMTDIYKELNIYPGEQNSVNARKIRLVIESLNWKYGVYREKYKKTVTRGFKKIKESGEGTGGEVDLAEQLSVPNDQIF